MVRYQILAAGGVFDHQARANVMPRTPEWSAYQQWLTEGNTPLPPDAVGQLDLAEARAQRMAEIDAFAAGLRNTVIRGRSAGEMSAWAIKLNEARNFGATGNPADAPTLALTAQIRGISLADLVGRVLAQAQPFLQIEAAIDGIRGRHCDAIDAMTDVRDVVTYDWRTDWPNLSGGE